MSHPPPNYSGPPYSPPPGDQKSSSGPGGYTSPPPPSGPPPSGSQNYYPPPPQGYPPPPGPPQHPPPQNYGGPPPQHYAPPPQQIHQQPYDPNRGHASPPPTPQVGGGVAVTDTMGQFSGGTYKIDHRDCNTLLTLQLQMGCPIEAKPGAMVAMSTSITLKGAVKFSMKKMLAGGEMTSSKFTGPGELCLAPPALGDIVPIRLDGQTSWSVGKDAFLAATDGVKKDYKSQGLGKGLLSGEGFFVYKISGSGILFVTSLGAIVVKKLNSGEQYIVDNDHLVAWNCKYDLQRVASGGILSNMASAEGLTCRFTGPGTVYFQTRNPTALGAWIASHMPSGGGA